MSFANCGLLHFVGGEIEDEAQLLVQTPESLQASLGIDVRVNTDVMALDTKRRVLTIWASARTRFRAWPGPPSCASVS